MALNIHTEIIINKSPKDVWETLTDFPNYPEWNPFITRIEQVSKNQLVAVMRSGKSDTTFKPTILKMAGPSELRWRGKLGNMSGIFTGEHYFILTTDSHGTKLSHGEKFSGILAWILWPFIKSQIRDNFTSMNMALKQRVESS